MSTNNSQGFFRWDSRARLPRAEVEKPNEAVKVEGKRAPQLPGLMHFEKQNFYTLREELFATGKLFEDPLFPASQSSIYYSTPPPIQGTIEWKRPSVRTTRTFICRCPSSTSTSTKVYSHWPLPSTSLIRTIRCISAHVSVDACTPYSVLCTLCTVLCAGVCEGPALCGGRCQPLRRRAGRSRCVLGSSVPRKVFCSHTLMR